MANTYDAIATTEVGSGGTASIEFTSIPQTYTDLKIVVSGRSTGTGGFDSLRVFFNGNTANFTVRELRRSGSSSLDSYAIGYAQAGYVTETTVGTSIFSNGEIYIPRYTSGYYKTSLADNDAENNSASGMVILSARLWSNTDAITSITVKPNDGSFVQYTSASLYGIKNS